MARRPPLLGGIGDFPRVSVLRPLSTLFSSCTLAILLARLEELQRSGRRVFRSHELGRVHRERLVQPCVRAGLVPAAALAGYRNDAVFIRGSRHVPPRWNTIPDAMSVGGSEPRALYEDFLGGARYLATSTAPTSSVHDTACAFGLERQVPGSMVARDRLIGTCESST